MSNKPLLIFLFLIGFSIVTYAQGKDNSDNILIIQKGKDDLATLYSAEIKKALTKLKTTGRRPRFVLISNIKDFDESTNTGSSIVGIIDSISSGSLDIGADPESLRERNKVLRSILNYNFVAEISVTEPRAGVYSFLCEFSELSYFGNVENNVLPTPHLTPLKNGEITIPLDFNSDTESNSVTNKFFYKFLDIFPQIKEKNDVLKNRLIKRKKYRSAGFYGLLGAGAVSIGIGYFGDLTTGNNLYKTYSDHPKPSAFIADCPDCGSRSEALEEANRLRRSGRDYISAGIGLGIGAAIFYGFHKYQDSFIKKSLKTDLKLSGNELSLIINL